jgi:deazaflavin-dependent oxidoreductase (nitroreductase family)
MGLWVIKHLISPIDRFVIRASGGRLPPPSSLAVPSLLLTVVGRGSGEDRTVPLVYVRDGERFIVGNARPAGERRNPWVLNLRAAGGGRIQIGRQIVEVAASELDETDVERWWPALTSVWPAFADQFAATRERTMFILQPSELVSAIRPNAGRTKKSPHQP